MTQTDTPKTILITGASTGMGRDMAERFSKEGWQVAATMRNPDRDGAALAALPGVKTYALDVTDTTSIQSAVKAAEDDFGGLDVLVNNAGVGLVGPMEGASEAQIAQQIAVNLAGPVHVTRAVLPGMRARKSGTIVNITSIGGRITMPHNALYHSMKWGLEGLTEALAYELRPFGIAVKAVAPGGVKTDFAGRSLNRADPSVDPDYGRQMQAFIKAATGRSEGWSEPSVVSDVVYEAVTDGTDKIRYLAGEDAKAMWAGREQLGDTAWVTMMTERFGL
jgi:NAD(P)-dependent dehydrogenase (short-subunit alcohol dehydrogenase family)